MDKKKILLICAVVFSLIVLMSVYSLSYSGFLSKAFTKTIFPGESIEENITVRKFYNMTVRFRTSLNGSDLTFDDADANISTKHVNGSQIHFLTGIISGKVYSLTDKADIDGMSSITVRGLDKYDDVVDQPVNFSFIGTKAYLTVLVSKKTGNGTISGFVFDELTGQSIGNLGVFAFDSGSNVNSTEPVSSTLTNSVGRFLMSLYSDADGKSYDVYVSDYPVS